MSQGTRKTTILDAAEQLFADHGFDGVSMRMVADRAPVGLGLLTYHFASKEILFESVVGRRATILTNARRAALDALHEPTLEELLIAFIGPYRDFIQSGEPGWRSYARLQALITQDARWTGLVTRYFADLGHEMIEHILRAEPRLSQEMAVRGYVHVIGNMVSLLAATGLVDRFSHGALSSEDIAGAFDPLITFAAGGIKALAQDASAPKP